jgi:uncharacterized protein (TIGR00255 family)
MLKSMTAYGRASLNTKVGHFVIEIQSVNRKFLDVSVTLPQELSQFDIEIKKWILPHVTRGQVTIKVSATFEGVAPFIIRPNLPLARQLKAAWQAIIQDLHLEEQEFQLSLLAEHTGLLSLEENHEHEEVYRQALKETLEAAMKGFLQMKIQEGAALQADIVERLDKICQSMRLIERKTPDATKKYREKLVARLEELLPGQVENEERILREVALFAEKIDIAEEITRFFCHLAHVEELMRGSLQGVGKTLEFVLQELNRETNTVGSKSSDLEIARAVIEIKSELERIREQIQNVE